MPRWTPEARERQRQLIQGFRPWESSTGARTVWGKFCSSNNGYTSMPKLSGMSGMEDERAVLVAAAKGLIQLLQTILEQGFKPSEQNLRDFRLALKVLHKLGASQDALYYGELFQALVRSFEKGELSPRVPNSEVNKNLLIAGSALRQVIEQSLKGKLEQGQTEQS